MKTKTPIKILIICLFISLIIGFIFYKSGYILAEEKIIINDERTRMDRPVTSEEDYDVNPFKDLKSEGGFVPKNFRKLYTEPYKPSLLPALSSSKSSVGLIEVDFSSFNWSLNLKESIFDIQMNKQLKSKK